LQSPMRFKPPNCKRLQGAADARRRARRRTFVLQVPDNKADAVPCERLPLNRQCLNSCRLIATQELAGSDNFCAHNCGDFSYKPISTHGGPPISLTRLLMRFQR
jgi:hypothetical protein